MKNYTYFLILLFLNTSSCLPSAQPLMLYDYIFSWSLDKKDYTTDKQLPVDYNFAQVKTFQTILPAALQNTNQTIITMKSNNDRFYRSLQIQLTDRQNKSHLLITFRVHSNNPSASTDSIWNIIFRQANNNIGATYSTAGQLSELTRDADPDFKRRLQGLIHCLDNETLVFYPRHENATIQQEAIIDPAALNKYLPSLDPRVVAQIQAIMDDNKTRPIK